MLRKVVRTYEKKKTGNSLKKINEFIKLDLTSKIDDTFKENEINHLEGYKNNEDLLDYDPFETTFDRIAKDAVVPAIPPDYINDDSWSGSSSDKSSEKENNQSLFHISFNNPSINISPNVKHEKSSKIQSYNKNIKSRHKKASVTKTLINSQYTKGVRKIEKKKNQTKVYKRKEVKSVKETKNKKQRKSNNTENSYTALKNSNDQLCKENILNTDINNTTNNENIIDNNIISFNNGQKNDIDLFNKSVKPLKEITDNIKINSKKKTYRLKSMKKKQNISYKNNETLSLISSVSHKNSNSKENKFKIKSCSVVLHKDNIKNYKSRINKPNYALKECYISLKNISNNTSINNEYKSSTNDLKNQCKNSNKIIKDYNLEINPISSTPVAISKKKSIYSLSYSPIGIDSSLKNIHHRNEDKTVSVSRISASLDTLQLNDLHVVDQTNIIDELDKKNKISYMKDRKIEKSISNDNLSINDDIKLDEQKNKILHLETFRENFINNRETYATIFMDDSIGIALRENNNKIYQEKNKPLLNHINFSAETCSGSLSLFDDYEKKLDISENDEKMREIRKSFIDKTPRKSNVNTELESKSISLDMDNTEKKIKLEILKEEESLVTITKEKSIEEHIEINDGDIEERNCKRLTNENHFLTRSKDSIKIDEIRQQQNRKVKFDLSDICENENNINQYNEKMSKNILSKNLLTNSVDTSINVITNSNERNSLINKERPSSLGKHIFLKPGKSWTRSLSILSNLQNGLNLNRISIEKGKRWRHSVKDILDMQKKDLSLIYTETDEYSKKPRLSDETKIQFSKELVTDVYNTNQPVNSERIVRRTSIRIVRDSRIIKNVNDASFLEVYGIQTKVQNRLTLPKINRNIEYNTQYNNMESNFAEVRLLKTAKDVILERCSQQDYLPFKEICSTTYLKFCRKIGEGVYGEVFLYEKDEQKSVLKIIPIEGDQLVNGEPQKKFNEILSEIIIAKELHNLRFNKNHKTNGFVEVKSIKCIKGKYPEEMINLWKKYDEEKTSDNDCPSMFDENQLYISLELGHGGQDLESFVFQTASEAYTLFIQAALVLAVAERSLKFEHRDLHWGNILISPTDEQFIYYKINNKNISVPSNGVKVCIIDFSLSRMSYQGCCIFNDLALDPALFTAQGEYQFEIYRLMKDKVLNNWQEFEPYTNILWLHYVIDKMIKMVRYKKKNLKKHKNAIIQLKDLKEIILSYQSAFDLVNNCEKITNLLIKS